MRPKSDDLLPPNKKRKLNAESQHNFTIGQDFAGGVIYKCNQCSHVSLFFNFFFDKLKFKISQNAETMMQHCAVHSQAEVTEIPDGKFKLCFN